MTPELDRVIALATRRGACVRVVDQNVWDRAADRDWFHEAPFSHLSLAIDERDRIVYVLASDVGDKEVAGSVVHELAHLHASRRESIHNANEYGWMGWEFAVSRETRVRRAWDLAMKDYGLGEAPAGIERLNSMDWGEITLGERHAIIADRMKAARKTGIVDTRGRAVWHRLPAATCKGRLDGSPADFLLLHPPPGSIP